MVCRVNMYSKKITRNQPALITILLDVSNSMNSEWGSSGKSLAAGAMYAVNRTIRDLLFNACIPEGEVLNYINLAVYGYGADDDGNGVSWRLGKLSEPSTGYALAQDWAGSQHRMETIDLGRLADNAQIARSQKLPIWVEEEATGWTPMCAGFEKAASVVKAHIANYPESFPPIVINITDGQPTDHNGDYSNLQKAALRIKQQETEDGKALLFNVHLDQNGEQFTIMFPDMPPQHSEYARELAKCSSILPAEMSKQGRKELKIDIPESAYGYCLNADFQSLVAFLKIGTTVVVSEDDDEEEHKLIAGPVE